MQELYKHLSYQLHDYGVSLTVLGDMNVFVPATVPGEQCRLFEAAIKNILGLKNAVIIQAE